MVVDSSRYVQAVREEMRFCMPAELEVSNVLVGVSRCRRDENNSPSYRP